YRGGGEREVGRSGRPEPPLASLLEQRHEPGLALDGPEGPVAGDVRRVELAVVALREGALQMPFRRGEQGGAVPLAGELYRHHVRGRRVVRRAAGQRAALRRLP